MKKNEVHQNNKSFRIYKKEKKIEHEHIAINTFNTLRNKKLLNFFKKQQLFRITGGDAYNYCLFVKQYRCNY